MRETALQTSRSTKKDGEELFHVPEQSFPWSLWRTMVEQISALHPLEDYTRVGQCALKEATACGELKLEQYPGWSCCLWRGTHKEAGFLAGALVCGEDPHLSSLFLKVCSLLKNCSLLERPTLEKFVKDCVLWERPNTGAGQKCEEEGAAETKCHELTTTFIPDPLALLVEGRM